MPVYRNFNLSGINHIVNPLLQPADNLLRAVNVETDVIGAKKKRAGYITYLGTPDTNQVNTLFDWHRNNGTQFWNYRASGSIFYYSQQGTGAWTVCGNGTIPNNDNVYGDVLADTLVITSPNGTTRHSTNGTSFTDTTSAPVGGVGVTEFQNRIWIPGTASALNYSTAGTPTDWTSDSSAYVIGGPGKLLSSFKNNNRVVVTKNSGQMFRYDGYNLTDQVTDLGPTSAQSIALIEGFRFYLNRLGIFGYGGNNPELISNPIEKYIYNDDATGIVGTTFDNAPAVVHQYNYYLSVGSVQDNLTDEIINPAVLTYDYQKDEWMTNQFANQPTAFHSFKDASGNQQLIFGDAAGQCYQLSGTAVSDNGAAISSVLEGVINFGQPETDKKFNTLWAFANPGCQATLQVAIGDSFSKDKKNWISIGDLTEGYKESRFPSDTRGKLLFWKLSETSTNARFHFYGMACDYDNEDRR